MINTDVSKKVTHVEIKNRDFPSAAEKLKGVQVFIGDTLLGSLDGTEKGEWFEVNCKQAI